MRQISNQILDESPREIAWSDPNAPMPAGVHHRQAYRAFALVVAVMIASLLLPIYDLIGRVTG